MKKTTIAALIGGLIAATTAFAPAASAGYGHRHFSHGYSYKTYSYKPYYTYSYRPTYYVQPTCKWVFHYGQYKKVCW